MSSSQLSPRVIFMGSPDFALPSLEGLAAEFNVVGVVTQPDRPFGRGRKPKAPPVKEWAQELGIPVIQPQKLNEPAAFAELAAWQPELIIVAAYGQILRSNVLELPHIGCINVHASLLPRWRGAAPIQAAILAGDELSGISIMKMDVGLDTGPILSQEAIPLDAQESAATLSEKLARLGAELLLRTLPDYLAGDLKLMPQSNENSTYAPMLNREDGELDFSRPASELERRVRAFHPWPGTFFRLDSAFYKVHQARALAGSITETGQLAIKDGLPAVATSDGWLLLETLQAPGKRTIGGEEFLRGAREWTGQADRSKEEESN